jgi:hypothetical protein
MNAMFEFAGKLLDSLKGLPGLRRDQKRKATLRGLLEKDADVKWRSLSVLARSIGASEEKTTELLVSIGARGSVKSGAEVWGLKSRVGTTGRAQTTADE